MADRSSRPIAQRSIRVSSLIVTVVLWSTEQERVNPGLFSDCLVIIGMAEKL